jgi:hypothetical protein
MHKPGSYVIFSLWQTRFATTQPRRLTHIDAHYVSLFLATAQTLDARARLLGFDSPPAAGAPQQPRLSN